MIRWTASRKLEVIKRIENEGWGEIKDYLEEHNISHEEVAGWREEARVRRLADKYGIKVAA